MASVRDLWHNKDRTRSKTYGTGSRWQAMWTEEGRPRRKSFSAKESAEDHLTWVRHNQRSGTYVDKDRGRIFVRDLLDEWVDTLLHYRASTLSTTKSDVSATIEPHWGGYILADIKRSDVQKWVSSMKKAARTVETIHGRFLTFLEWCVEEGRLVTNPAKAVNLPRGKKRVHIFLTREQVAAIADTIEAEYKGLIWILATTGLRMGEMCEMRVKDVDVRRRRVKISRAVVFVSGKAVVGDPKSGEPRTVPVTATGLEYLVAACVDKGPEDLLFPAHRGGQIRANNFKRRNFDRAVGKINDEAARRRVERLPVSPSIPEGLWVHDLRHTAASWAVQSGASVKSVQRMLGHATAAMTLDTYAGLFDQDLDDVAVRMEEFLKGV